MSEDIIIHPLLEPEIPTLLYRIDYPGSWTHYNKNVIGFRAKDRITMGPATITQFKNHLKWNADIPSRFISTVSDKAYAISWARSLDQYKDIKTRDTVRLVTIRPNGGYPMYVYNMKKAFDDAGVQPPEKLRQFLRDDEYLVLDRVPASHVIQIEGIDVAEDTTEARETELIADPRRGFGDFIQTMEELCTEMKLLVESFKLLGSHTRAIINDPKFLKNSTTSKLLVQKE
ncbi:hypothetical protein TWF281_006298 [Arthrobotrys megalospora]